MSSGIEVGCFAAQMIKRDYSNMLPFFGASDTELLQDPEKQTFLIQDGLSRCSLFSRRLDIYGGINSIRDLPSGAGAAHDLDPQKGCKFIPLESALESVLSSPYQLPASDRAHDLYDIAMYFYCDLKSGKALKPNYTIKSAVFADRD